MDYVHTLGPWIAEPDKQASCNNRHWIVGVSRNDGRRAHVAADVVTHNVPLICAAPDLLEALQMLADGAQSHIDSIHGDSEFCAAWVRNIACAAITKATSAE